MPRGAKTREKIQHKKKQKNQGGGGGGGGKKKKKKKPTTKGGDHFLHPHNPKKRPGVDHQKGKKKPLGKKPRGEVPTLVEKKKHTCKNKRGGFGGKKITPPRCCKKSRKG